MSELTSTQQDALERADRFGGTLFVTSSRNRGQLVHRETAMALAEAGLVRRHEGAEGQRNFIRLTDEGRESLEKNANE